MSDAAFLEQARLATIELFHTYCYENDMVKTLSFFSKESYSIGWGEQEVYPNYQAISDTLYERMTIPYHLELSNVQTEIINATDNFCVILYTANLSYQDDKGVSVKDLERATLVFRKEQGEPKIVYLHSSAASRLYNLGKIIPLEHGAEATRHLTKLECDRSMAIDMCNHTPNGLVYCQISEHYPLIYANPTFCQLLGCKDFTELMEYTKGMLDGTVYQEDLPRVHQALLSHINACPYTINYRMVTKQGTLQWVLERGQYILDGETGEEYYICTIIPLELDQNDFSYGNLVDYDYIDKAKISVELFLEQTLEYMGFEDRSKVCEKLLRHCCDTLQTSGGVVVQISGVNQKLEPLYYYDNKNIPMSYFHHHFTWQEFSQFFTEDGLSICSDFSNIPQELFNGADVSLVRSSITKLIKIQDQPAYLLTLHHRDKTHLWTENERDIVEQAAKLYELLLDEDF